MRLKKVHALLSGGKTVESVATYNAFYEVSHAVTDVALRIVQLQRVIAEKQGEIVKLRGQIRRLRPGWRLDAPLNYDGTRGAKAFVGYFPMEAELSQLYELLAGQDPQLPPVHIEIVGRALNQTLVFVLCRRGAERPLKKRAARAGVLLSAGVVRPAAEGAHRAD